MRWIGPYVNRKNMPYFSSWDEKRLLEKPSSNEIAALDVEVIGITIINFLDQPNQISFEQLRHKIYEFFKLLNKFPQLEDNLIIKLIELIPKSSTDSFNHFFSDNTILASSGLIASCILIFKICNVLALDLTILMAVGLFLYGSSLAEKGYTLFSKCLNSEDKYSFNNSKIAEIRSKNRNLLMFPDISSTKDKLDIQPIGSSITFGKPSI